jgi:hypothetical protein
MTDRELLELSAKAAGIALRPMEIKNVTKQGDDRFIGYMADAEQCPRGWFNPLEDDGDALRLAVKLRIWVEPWIRGDSACARAAVGEVLVDEPHYGDDPERATRRAIVLAAAELGKEKT